MLWMLLSLAVQIPFDYPDFTRHENLRIVGDARHASEVLRLTEAKNQKAGAAWHTHKQSVTGGFDTTFKLRLTHQRGLGDGADGLAFVLQNSGDKALAGRGSAGGWGFGDGQRNKRAQGIPRAIAIFF